MESVVAASAPQLKNGASRWVRRSSKEAANAASSAYSSGEISGHQDAITVHTVPRKSVVIAFLLVGLGSPEPSVSLTTDQRRLVDAKRYPAAKPRTYAA